MERTAEALAVKIREWELSAGESFTDYYMHDRVKNVSWAFWLLGKGFSQRANFLIDMITASQYLEQDILYDLYGDLEAWNETTHMQNVQLWAEFLVASDRYWKDITEWFAEHD